MTKVLKITKLIKNYNSQLFVNEYDDNEGDEHDDDSDASEKVYP